MNYDSIVFIMREVVNNFSVRDCYDEHFVIRCSKEILEHIDLYEEMSDCFPYLEPSFVFFFRFLFGDTEEVRQCLSSAERTYRREVGRGVVKVDWLREAVFKTTLISLKTKNNFFWVYFHLILKPLVEIRKKIRKEKNLKISVSNGLNLVLDELEVSAKPEDLFFQLIQR